MSNELRRFSRVTAVDEKGELMVNAGRYARRSVLTVYEMIGGDEAMAEWAEENPGEFYTKMFTKVVGKEVEHNASESVEALLERLDEAEATGEVVDADYELVEDGSGEGKLSSMAQAYADGEDDDED